MAQLTAAGKSAAKAGKVFDAKVQLPCFAVAAGLVRLAKAGESETRTSPRLAAAIGRPLEAISSFVDGLLSELLSALEVPQVAAAASKELSEPAFLRSFWGCMVRARFESSDSGATTRTTLRWRSLRSHCSSCPRGGSGAELQRRRPSPALIRAPTTG